MTDTQRILDAVRKLVRLLRLADRAAQRDVGLSGAQLFVLHELGRTPELSLNDLAEHIAEHTGKLAKPSESISTFAELGNANQLRNAFSVFLIAVLVGQKRTTSCLHPPPSTAFRSAHT